MTGYPWREPGEESVDLYPGVVVHDGRMTGSLTFGRVRTPLWAPQLGFLDAEDYAVEPEAQKAAEAFLRDLLQARGEYARLLLVLADAERREQKREMAVLDEATGGQGGCVNVTPGDPDAVTMPPAWWEDPTLYAPVVAQLRRCLALFDLPLPAGAVVLPGGPLPPASPSPSHGDEG